jgi:Kef-type K+ transport system membrane component KefB
MVNFSQNGTEAQAIIMSDFLQVSFVLVVILFAAKTAGYLSQRAGQPSILGELLVGLVLGPSLINLIHLPFINNTHLDEIVATLGEMGVLLLMFLAGLELNLTEFGRSTAVSAFSGTLGVILPAALVAAAGMAFGLHFIESVYLGLALGATSVSISAQTLIELKVIRSKVGLGLMGAAVFDDILVILLLSIFMALTSKASGFLGILVIVLSMALFLGISAGFGLWVLPRLTKRVQQLPISQGTLTLAIIVLLLYGMAAELLGYMAAITGAFIAGLMFARTPQKSTIEHGIHALAYSFFVPIFFVSIGLNTNLAIINPAIVWLLFVLTLAAILGKILGAGLGARLAKLSWLESIQLGVGMVSRGEVGLILANFGLHQSLINQDIFSTIVVIILVTTLVTPPLLRLSFSWKTLQKPETERVP